MRNKNAALEKDVKKLGLEDNITEILINNEIVKVGNLWELNRKKLKAMGLKDGDINQVVIKLQLLGLDLNRKVYK